MNQHDDNEDDDAPKTLSDALAFIACNLGVFVFKCMAIIVLWLGVVQLLEKWLLK
jgi:hypothetical protein